MTIFFKAKTTEAQTVKILAELLQNNLKSACFRIDKSGLYLSMMDQKRCILITLELKSENFNYYKYIRDDTITIGLNMNHLYRMLRSVKRKNSLQMFIDDANPTDFGIKVIPTENNRVTTSFIKIQDIQALFVDAPTIYNHSIIIPGNDFQKMIKDMVQIGNTINISSSQYKILFECNSEGLIKRQVEFGEFDLSEDDSDDNSDVSIYFDTFNVDKLNRVTKIANLSSTFKMSVNKNMPIRLTTNIGSIGQMSIFIKSNTMTNN